MASPANFPATTSAGGFCVCAKRGLCTSEEIKTRETKVHQKRPVYNKRGLRRQTDRLKQLRLYVGRGLSTSEDQKKDQRCIVFDSCPSFTDLLWHNVYVKKPAATSAGGFCVCVWKGAYIHLKRPVDNKGDLRRLTDRCEKGLIYIKRDIGTSKETCLQQKSIYWDRLIDYHSSGSMQKAAYVHQKRPMYKRDIRASKETCLQQNRPTETDWPTHTAQAPARGWQLCEKRPVRIKRDTPKETHPNITMS